MGLCSGARGDGCSGGSNDPQRRRQHDKDGGCLCQNWGQPQQQQQCCTRDLLLVTVTVSRQFHFLVWAAALLTKARCLHFLFRSLVSPIFHVRLTCWRIGFWGWVLLVFNCMGWMCLFDYRSLQWGTMDAEIQSPSDDNPELVKIPSFKPRVS